jgi:hypothetical protein
MKEDRSLIVSLHDTVALQIQIPSDYSIFVTKMEHRSGRMMPLGSCSSFDLLNAIHSNARVQKEPPMNEKHCMCTAVFCGHAFGETCPNQEAVRVRISVGTERSIFSPQREIGMCESCWTNLQRNLPGLLYSSLPVKKAS